MAVFAICAVEARRTGAELAVMDSTGVYQSAFTDRSNWQIGYQRPLISVAGKENTSRIVPVVWPSGNVFGWTSILLI
ncbi:MAG: hypothetical protein ACLTSZ_12570 [Lachnospiraceae bacterium]